MGIEGARNYRGGIEGGTCEAEIMRKKMRNLNNTEKKPKFSNEEDIIAIETRNYEGRAMR